MKKWVQIIAVVIVATAFLLLGYYQYITLNTLKNESRSINRNYEALKEDNQILTDLYSVLENEIRSISRDYEAPEEDNQTLQKTDQQQSKFAYEKEVLASSQQVKAGVVIVRAAEEGGYGEGTGFLIHPDGYILTNRHVVEGETNLTVITIDNKTYDAQLVAMSSKFDLAIIRAPIEEPTVLEFGDSQELSEGDVVFNIGHPQEFGTWVVEAGEFKSFSYGEIRIDKPGGTGQSGSPLFNLEGSVIGIVYGGTPIEGERIGPDDQIVVWEGNAGVCMSGYSLALDTDTIYKFIKETLGEELTLEIF